MKVILELSEYQIDILKTLITKEMKSAFYHVGELKDTWYNHEQELHDILDQLK